MFKLFEKVYLLKDNKIEEKYIVEIISKEYVNFEWKCAKTISYWLRNSFLEDNKEASFYVYENAFFKTKEDLVNNLLNNN